MNITDNKIADPCSLNLSKGYRGFFGLAFVLVAFLGTVGNSILSFYVIRSTERRSLINILLATMAICDTLISFLCTPFDFLTIIYSMWVFGEYMCSTHSFVLSVLVVQNVTILVIISIDRYCILVHKKDRLRGCHMATMISACTIFSVIVSCPPLFNAGKLVFANEYCRRICDTSSKKNIYSFLFSSFLFVLPCGLLLLAYVHIMVAIRKTTRIISPQNHLATSETNGSLNVKFKQKTFSTILWLYAAAMICKLPLAITTFIQGLSKNVACPVAPWVILLTYMNSAINPIIYAVKISEYWMMLTGKFDNMKNRVKTFRRSRNQSRPQNIYVITTETSSSVL